VDEQVRAHLLQHNAHMTSESAGSKEGRLTIHAPLIRGVSSMWGVGAGVRPLAVAFLPIISCRCRATYSKRFCRTCMNAHTAVRTTMTSIAEKMRVSFALAAVFPYAYPAWMYPS